MQEDQVITVTSTEGAGNWRDIAGSLFKLGATSYGGPAIMGIMQAELQERRRWVSEAIMRGMSPAVIGVLAVPLAQLAPAALPDLFAVAILVATIVVMVAFGVGAFKGMIAGALLCVLRSYLPVVRGMRAAARLVVS